MSEQGSDSNLTEIKTHGGARPVPAELTENAAPTDSGMLMHPRKPEGCHKGVWKDRERESRGRGVLQKPEPALTYRLPQASLWPYMVRSRGLLWKAPSGMELMSLL